MILRYVYSDHNGSKQLVGCVVRTDDNRLGYSAVHPRDRRKLTKKLARKIALGRAEKCEIREDGGWWWKHRETGMTNYWTKRVHPRLYPHLAALAALGPKGEVCK